MNYLFIVTQRRIYNQVEDLVEDLDGGALSFKYNSVSISVNHLQRKKGVIIKGCL